MFLETSTSDRCFPLVNLGVRYQVVKRHRQRQYLHTFDSRSSAAVLTTAVGCCKCLFWLQVLKRSLLEACKARHAQRYSINAWVGCALGRYAAEIANCCTCYFEACASRLMQLAECTCFCPGLLDMPFTPLACIP